MNWEDHVGLNELRVFCDWYDGVQPLINGQS